MKSELKCENVNDHGVRVGAYYKHYKGNFYKVIGIAKHTETDEVLVIYTSLKDDSLIWAIPLSMWNDGFIVDGVRQPRFVEVF